MTDGQPERTIAQQKSEAIFWSRVFWTILTVAVCITVFEFLRHVYEWLRYGESNGASLTIWFDAPKFKWVGIQKVVDLIWNLPIWLLSSVTVFVSGWFAGLNDDVVENLGNQT